MVAVKVRSVLGGGAVTLPAATARTGISTGIGFEAKAVKLRALVTPPVGPDPCP